MHLLLFLSLDYLSYINSLGFFIYFLSDEGPMLETLGYTISVLAVHRPFYISIFISTLPTQYTMFISLFNFVFCLLPQDFFTDHNLKAECKNVELQFLNTDKQVHKTRRQPSFFNQLVCI